MLCFFGYCINFHLYSCPNHVYLKVFKFKMQIKLLNEDIYFHTFPSKMTARHNATVAQVTVEHVNKTISAEVDVTTQPVAVRDLTSLATDSQFTIGGVTVTSRG